MHSRDCNALDLHSFPSFRVEKTGDQEHCSPFLHIRLTSLRWQNSVGPNCIFPNRISYRHFSVTKLLRWMQNFSNGRLECLGVEKNKNQHHRCPLRAYSWIFSLVANSVGPNCDFPNRIFYRRSAKGKCNKRSNNAIMGWKMLSVARLNVLVKFWEQSKVVSLW